MIELMVVLGIVIILIGVAAPGFKGAIAKYRMQNEMRSLRDDLALAREESRDSTGPVSVCGSTNGTSCNSSAWDAGHIVFRDGGAAGVVDGADRLIRQAPAARAGLTVTAEVVSTAAGFTRGYLQFAEGKLDTGAVRFTTCQASYKPLQVTVSRSGLISSATGAGACS